MIRIGTHHVTVRAVPDRPGEPSPPERRFAALCRDCGTWRGPSLHALHDALLTVPCRPTAPPTN